MNNLPLAKTIGIASLVDMEELEKQIRIRLHGRVRHFRLLLRDGGVVLRGDTHTFYGKQLAQHAVMKATHLPILANEIRVR